MSVRALGLAAVMMAAVAVWACNTSNPARPSMSFVAPVAQQPSNGASYNFTQQPISLQIVNAVRTGSSAVTYSVEVSSSASFTPTVFSQDGIAEGTSGTTNVSLPSLTGNTTYYWRWRAVVDGITGEPSPTQSFFLRPNIQFSVPAVEQPTAGAAVFTARPTFTVANATRTGPAGTTLYEFQVSSSAAFGTLIASGSVQEDSSGATSWSPTTDLAVGSFFWRARARDAAVDVSSEFTAAVAFDRKFGVDLNAVVYIQGPNISQWPQTAHLTAAYKTGDTTCTEYEGGYFPETDFFDDPTTQIVANQWIFVNFSGTWYGGAGHWLRPGQYCKSEYDDNFFTDAFVNPPFNTLVMTPGREFGVMVSTPARFYPAMATSDQRSDVQIITW